MTYDQLRKIDSLICDLRFIQAAALVASKLNGTKQAVAYMHDLGELQDAIRKELETMK